MIGGDGILGTGLVGDETVPLGNVSQTVLYTTVPLGGTNVEILTNSFIVPTSLTAGNISGSSTVTGDIPLTHPVSGSISCKTVAHGNLHLNPEALNASVNTRTTVTGNPIVSNLLGTTIACSTTVSGSLAVVRAVTGAIHTKTVVTAKLNLSPEQLVASNISCRTTISANLTFWRDISGTNITCSTSLGTVTITISDLKGSIQCSTGIGAPALNLVVGPTVAINGQTSFSTPIVLGLSGAYFQGSIVCATSVHALMYLFPEDSFGSIQGHTTCTGAITFVFGITATVHGKTVITAKLVLHIALVGRTIACKTVVVGLARYGYDPIRGITVVSAHVALTSLQVAGAIHAKTVVTAIRLINPWSGIATCRTHVTVTTLKILHGLIASTVIAKTQFHSIIYWDRSGRNPPIAGPFGSVNLTDLPKGDLGLPSIIEAGTAVVVALLALRHRQLSFQGSLGYGIPGSYSWTGNMARGTGVKKNESVDPNGSMESEKMFQGGPKRHAVNFV